ncbi:importin subunit beta-1 [Strongylocentrotus purpuratus]|uniref:Importin N-terminal domain-containing protein n=1 Tax=Strongylocentrotus purpuratus TaxID=7668 RepID=A0A7M7RAF2_STRPU|nr:importin subunit beta-1 [Strongylocentrotus purpuratus]|eukprot:XP_781574.3 PREDICTED: importin subunit beta-1 [Strongylocentrotus purpuratus]
MDLVAYLEKTVSPDTAELERAQKFLEQTAIDNFPQFLNQLSEILVNPTNGQVARIAAGLQLKNALTSKDPNVRLQYQHRWLALALDVRTNIKRQVLLTLGTEVHRPSSAAQCIAGIACTELPAELWPELLPQLVSNVLNPAQDTDLLKESSLEAIGYICQDIELKFVGANSNEILTAIVQGMRKEESNMHVKLAATNALLNSLEITKANFEKNTERHVIMQVVCEATQVKDTQVRVAALQCLVKIMSLYYVHMEDYMGSALFAITIDAMKSDIDEVRLQGIEFWSNVCDEEMDLAIEASEAEEMNRAPEHTSKFYAKGALEYLVDILVMTLTSQQDENDDEDEWNPCKAAGVCLMLLANCCEDDIVSHAVPFIHNHIRSDNWQYRDAAVMAFGSILEGPNETLLNPLVMQAFPVLIELLADPCVIVRDTVAWTLGRICELLPQAVLEQPYFDSLLVALIECLGNEPRVAANVCWAFSSLAENAYESASVEPDKEPETYCLSKAFEVIVKKLLETTDRTDAHQANLRSAAYEALMEMVKNSATDCYRHVLDTTNIILRRIQLILQMESHVLTASDRTQYNDLQSLLCATLQSVLRKMKPDDANKISDNVMNALLQMFDNTSGKSGGVQEDALLAVGTLVEVIGIDFLKYMEHFTPFLYLGLKNYQEYQVCVAAVGLVGDICRALNKEVLPYCPQIMTLLLENIQNDNVHRTVKPQILSVFGDIALAIGSDFQHYLQVVLITLQQASMAEIEKTDFDMIDYLNDLREGCLEAYTGIVQGLKGDDKVASSEEVKLVFPHVSHMVSFIEHLTADDDHTDSNVAACAGLIGDLCAAFGTEMLGFLEQKVIQELLTEGRRSKVMKTKTLATWATKEIRKLRTTLDNKPQ